jgi:hypothetical protein
MRFHWRAVILYSASQFLTIALGVISIILAVWALLPEVTRETFLPATLLLIAVLPALAGFFITFRTMPATDYAKALVEGQRASTIVLVMSRLIDKLCRRFLRERRHSSKLSEQVREALGTPEGPMPNDLESMIKSFLLRIEKLIQSHHRHLRRLEAGKHAAAIELDIHHRRFCDHIVQFSPTIFREGIWNYLDSWRQVRDLLMSPLAPERKKERCNELLARIDELEQDCQQRREYQSQLSRFAFLHDAIVGFASSRSASGSLLEYASAVDYMARHYRRRLASTRDLEICLDEAAQCLAFLHRKQRAHPGFDLHTLLSALCSRPPRNAAFDTNVHSLQLSALEVARNDIGASSLSEQQLDALAQLNLDVQERVTVARESIALTMHQLFLRSSRPLFVVTNGYSKTVRDVLSLRPLPGHIRVYLLLQDEAEQLSTRIMKSEVKHGSKGSLRRTRGRVACGNAEMLLSLLGRTHSVLLLLGAECFDEEGRVAQTHGITTTFSTLTTEMKRHDIPYLVVVVAEGYKRLECELASSPFYTDHFDGVDIYPSGSVDLIISEEDTWPPNWETKWENAFGRAVTPSA